MTFKTIVLRGKIIVFVFKEKTIILKKVFFNQFFRFKLFRIHLVSTLTNRLKSFFKTNKMLSPFATIALVSSSHSPLNNTFSSASVLQITAEPTERLV